MAALPAYDISELVTKTDLALFGTELRAEMSELRNELRGEFRNEMSEFRNELRNVLQIGIAGIATRFDSLESSFARLNARIDRMFLTLVGGLIVIVAAMVGVVFMP